MRLARYFLILIFNLCWQQYAFSGERSDHSRSLLWEVKSQTATVYLLGSIHFANAGLYPLSATIEQAFARSAALMVEINPLVIDQRKLQQSIQERGTYSGDRTLNDELSADTLGLLKEHLTRVGIPLEGVRKLKPAVLALLLVTTQLQEMGFSPDYGIDMYFCRKAEKTMPILELESLQQQMDLLFNLPEQEMFLRYTLIELGEMETQFRELLNAWRMGDGEAINAMMLEPYTKKPEFKTIVKRMFSDRNVMMAEKIEQLLSQKLTYFVVVGAGHLVGDNGVVALLRRNHSVRQL